MTAMRVASWRSALIPMVVLIAGCLPQPPPALPPSFISEYSGASRPVFTVQTPPAGSTGQEIVAALRASDTSPMFRGRAIRSTASSTATASPIASMPGGHHGPSRLLLYPDCTDATADFGWAIIEVGKDVSAGYEANTPCGPNG